MTACSLSTCSDGFVRQIVIPGSLRKKEWVGVGDILLVSLRIGMTDDKVGDLMAKLYPEEIQTLKQKGDISEAWQAGGGGDGEGESNGFVFSDGIEEGDEEEEEDVSASPTRPAAAQPQPPHFAPSHTHTPPHCHARSTWTTSKAQGTSLPPTPPPLGGRALLSHREEREAGLYIETPPILSLLPASLPVL